MGVLRAIQPEPAESRYCERWVGQARQGTLFPDLTRARDGYTRHDVSSLLEVFATLEPTRAVKPIPIAFTGVLIRRPQFATQEESLEAQRLTQLL